MPRERKSSWSLTPLDLLLLAVPIAIALRYVPAWRNETLLFIVAGIAIVPLAGWMGRATEQLATRSGSGIGGFLNATFGNAAELIIGLVALSKGFTGVVKASITGSIIGNLLLVLGASILAGGLRHPKQTFNQTAARVSATSSRAGRHRAHYSDRLSLAAADTRPGGGRRDGRAAFAGHRDRPFPYLFSSLLFHLVTHRELFAGTLAVSKRDESHGLSGNRSPHWPSRPCWWPG